MGLLDGLEDLHALRGPVQDGDSDLADSDGLGERKAVGNNRRFA